MGTDSKIQWTEHTFNPVRGCTKISDGCDNCYAETMSHRNPKTLGEWGPKGKRSHAAESYWKQPEKWNEAAKAAGEVHRVFCASLADLFEGEHDLVSVEPCPDCPPNPAPGAECDACGSVCRVDGIMAGWVEGERGPRPDYIPMLDRMVETFAPLENLRVLALTKRPWNALHWREHRGAWPATWWALASVENQAAAIERVPYLLRLKELGAPVVGLSCEPLLGPVDLTFLDIERHPVADELGRTGAYCIDALTGANRDMGRPCRDVPKLDWVIAGGESGTDARPMHPAWARGLRDQCGKAGVPFHFKQWGEHAWGSDLGTGAATVTRVGKKAAGRLLDGREWNEVPRG